MALPDYQAFMLPTLLYAADQKDHSLAELRDALAKRLNLSPDDLQELLPSGKQTTFANRIAWAKVYLTHAGLLHAPKRGIFHITKRGQEVLAEKPSKIDKNYLMRFPEFLEFISGGAKEQIKNDSPKKISLDLASTTPEEALEHAYQQLRNELAGELLETIKNNSPYFFEKLVVHLLVQMGYGGSIKEAGTATKKTADEGIDGIIKEDKLGLDTIYLQAKRWEGSVGRPEIQRFVGALHGQRAKKGVFITTSHFSQEAVEYASHIDPKVVLIDGPTLVSLMMDHNVGVGTTATYELKKIDTDFFEE